ncbi:MAG: FkbM family methyltransferase [Reyranellaceae bacterium]
MSAKLSYKADRDGQAVLASATKRADGQPRFVMPLLATMIENDAGISYLVRHEVFHDGFERISRDIIDTHLEPGDVFVDIGAHWGCITLSALTRHPGRVRAIAVEPHPLNLLQLMRAVQANRLGELVEIVPAAAGERPGLARLAFNSTMGHSLLESDTRRTTGTPLRVPVVSIDQLLAERRDLDGSRLVVKIDVEGFEPEVLLGAKQALESGRVGLLVWERGFDYRQPERRAAVERSIDWLSRLGFRHYALPFADWGGPLLPLTPDAFLGNVFSFGPGVEKRDVYPQDFARRPPFNTSFRLDRSPAGLAAATELYLAAQSSDGPRWSDPHWLPAGAQERALAAAGLIAPGSAVLDLGCGAMALRAVLPADCRYAPADLVARSADTAVVDLNQGQFPAGAYDVAVLLNVVEFLHRPEQVLAACRQAASSLVLSYDRHGQGERRARLARGYFNDLSDSELEALLHRTGWRPDRRGAGGETLMLRCQAV